MVEDILKELRALGTEKNREGMKRFGIVADKAFGIPVPVVRNLAKKYKKNHELALELWESEYHEARTLAAFIDDPAKVTEKQMEKWVKDFDSWDICDQTCGLFDRTPFAFDKAKEWCRREEEFVRRAGFAMMASLAVHDKKASDAMFVEFFPLIEQYAFDERNFVRKAVNWALRQIGKRNAELHKKALACAERVVKQDHKSAKWIARDALRELHSSAVLTKLGKKNNS